MFSKSIRLISSLVLAVSLAACSSSEKRNAEQQAKAAEAEKAKQEAAIQAQKDAETKLFTQLKPNELRNLVQEGVVYSFPLMVMDATKETFVNPASPSPMKGPPNEFFHMRTFPDPSLTTVVSPNADTLYSSAWVDLAKEPIVLNVPATGSRFYMMQIMDAWTNVISSPGTRTTGNGPGSFAIVGPNWDGQLPANFQKIQSPTNMVWIIGRTYTRGPKDYEAVHAIQNRYQLAPLSRVDRSMAVQATPPKPEDANVPKFEWKASANDMVTSMDAKSYFVRLSHLLEANPPAAADKAALDKLAKIGVTPGHTVNFEDLPADVRKNLEDAVRAGYARVQDLGKHRPGRSMNGWVYGTEVGDFGTNYENRAAVAWVALGANLEADAIYPTTKVDSEGAPLKGANKYVLRFAKGQLPPVNGFWSVTLYNPKQGFVANSLNRYALGTKDGLKKNKDGSVSIYIQNANPGKARVANWLPAPKGDFNLMARLYWPKQAILGEEWQMPGVQKVRPPQRLTQKTLKRAPKRLSKR